jgi:biofilm PGA synthesis protein PgaD
MGKSGPGDPLMRAERPIISHPERQSLSQRFTTGTLTSIAWALWLYLWLPALSALLWIIGIHLTYLYIVRAPNESSLVLIFLIILGCSVIVSSWSSYNYIRFVGRTRRRGAAPVSHEAVGRLFGVSDPAMLSLLLTERRISLHFDEGGVLVRAEALERGNKTKSPKEKGKARASSVARRKKSRLTTSSSK